MSRDNQMLPEYFSKLSKKKLEPLDFSTHLSSTEHLNIVHEQFPSLILDSYKHVGIFQNGHSNPHNQTNNWENNHLAFTPPTINFSDPIIMWLVPHSVK